MDSESVLSREQLGAEKVPLATERPAGRRHGWTPAPRQRAAPPGGCVTGVTPWSERD